MLAKQTLFRSIQSCNTMAQLNLIESVAMAYCAKFGVAQMGFMRAILKRINELKR